MDALLSTDYVPYVSAAIVADRDMVMVKEVKISPAKLAEVLHYASDTGVFTWLVSVSSRGQKGRPAGTWLRMKNGKDYLSVTLDGRKLAAGQVAWCLQTGKWPDRAVFFRDEDPTNLKWDNLKLADHKAERLPSSDGKPRYRMSNEQIRHYGLRRNYNLTMTEYAEKFAAQNGVCAICKKAETAKVPGRVPKEPRIRIRDLCVDHDHKTGAVRELLCNACNHMLGHAADDPALLRAAADYLERFNKESDMCDNVKGPPE